MGPFFGQILQNVSCNFDDTTSTTTATSVGGAQTNEPGAKVAASSTLKKEAYSIFQVKLANLENRQRQEIQRFEQEMGGSQNEAEDHRPIPASAVVNDANYYAGNQDHQHNARVVGYAAGNNPE